MLVSRSSQLTDDKALRLSGRDGLHGPHSDSVLGQELHPGGLGLLSDLPYSSALRRGQRWGSWRAGQGALSPASITVTKSMSQANRCGCCCVPGLWTLSPTPPVDPQLQ